MRLCFRLLLVVLGVAVAPLLQAAQNIKVGAYHFPPYAIKPERGGGGLLPQLLEQLNRQQSEYRFSLVPTSATRRYRDFAQRRFDLIFFEMPAWGWQNSTFDAVELPLEDAEVYVAKAGFGRNEAYFSRLKGKRLTLVQGYHYALADFNTDPNYLAANYNAHLTYSHDSNMLMLLHGRADVSVVTRSYIRDFLVRYPEYADELLVSERIDQRYRPCALLRPDAPIDAQTLAALLEGLRESGELQALFGPAGIMVKPAVADSPATPGAAD